MSKHFSSVFSQYVNGFRSYILIFNPFWVDFYRWNESGSCFILLVENQLLQFSSVTQLCLTLCDPMDCSTPDFPVHHQHLDLTQTHVHWVSDAIQPSYPLSSPSPPAFNLSQHQGVFQWVGSLHQVAKGLEFQLQHQHQSFQCIFTTDFL